MTYQNDWKYRLFITTYGTMALGVAAVFSSMTFSFIPIVFAAIFLYLAGRHSRPWLRLSFNLYLLLALPLMWETVLPAYFSWLITVPFIPMISQNLGQIARPGKSIAFRNRWGISEGLVRTGIVVIMSITLAALLGKLSVMIAGTALIGWLALQTIRIVRCMPKVPIVALSSTHRVLADDKLDFTLAIESKFKYSGWLSLESPYKWVNVKPVSLPFTDSKAELKILMTPYLSGPSSVQMNGVLTDRWGMLSCQIEFEVADLQVIPRAKYATWLAQKYLESSKASAVMSMTSGMKQSKQSIGSRRGMDFYGTRLHQPGDSLTSIDWKHSMKLQDFVVREYEASQTSASLLIANLSASNAEAADHLVYTLLTTAITLAAEGIPTSIAAYDHEKTLDITEPLDSRRLVQKCLELSHKVVHWERSHRYLAAADFQRIRANKKRLAMLGKDSMATLVELMEVEIRAIEETATNNPATEAIKKGLSRTRGSASILFLSEGNHDNEALQVAKYNLRGRNRTFTEISLNSTQKSKGRKSAAKGTGQMQQLKASVPRFEVAHI